MDLNEWIAELEWKLECENKCLLRTLRNIDVIKGHLDNAYARLEEEECGKMMLAIIDGDDEE